MRASEEAANQMRSEAASELEARIDGIDRYEVAMLEVSAEATV